MTVAIERRGWHLDKSINPAYIVPFIAAIFTCLVWAGNINNQQGIQDQKLAAIEKRVDENGRITREDLKEINQKLDRLLSGTPASK